MVNQSHSEHFKPLFSSAFVHTVSENIRPRSHDFSVIDKQSPINREVRRSCRSDFYFPDARFVVTKVVPRNIQGYLRLIKGILPDGAVRPCPGIRSTIQVDPILTLFSFVRRPRMKRMDFKELKAVPLGIYSIADQLNLVWVDFSPTRNYRSILAHSHYFLLTSVDSHCIICLLTEVDKRNICLKLD